MVMWADLAAAALAVQPWCVLPDAVLDASDDVQVATDPWIRPGTVRGQKFSTRHGSAVPREDGPDTINENFLPGPVSGPGHMVSRPGMLGHPTTTTSKPVVIGTLRIDGRTGLATDGQART